MTGNEMSRYVSQLKNQVFDDLSKSLQYNYNYDVQIGKDEDFGKTLEVFPNDNDELPIIVIKIFKSYSVNESEYVVLSFEVEDSSLVNTKEEDIYLLVKDIKSILDDLNYDYEYSNDFDEFKIFDKQDFQLNESIRLNESFDYKTRFILDSITNNIIDEEEAIQGYYDLLNRLEDIGITGGEIVEQVEEIISDEKSHINSLQDIALCFDSILPNKD